MKKFIALSLAVIGTASLGMAQPLQRFHYRAPNFYQDRAGNSVLREDAYCNNTGEYVGALVVVWYLWPDGGSGGSFTIFSTSTGAAHDYETGDEAHRAGLKRANHVFNQACR